MNTQAERETTEMLTQAGGLYDEETLAMLRHDLINCLTTIRLAVALIGREGDPRNPHLQSARSSVDRMTRMLEDWRDLDQPAPRAAPRVFNLVKLVQKLCDALQPACALKGQSLALCLQSEAAYMIGHENDIARALDNLVSNAIKYTPRGGTVRVSVGIYGELALVQVQDDGIGIPAEERERLGQPYQRASNASSSGIPGTGLGLCQARQAIEQHGGELRLKSGPHGLGTSVELTLPLRSPRSA